MSTPGFWQWGETVADSSDIKTEPSRRRRTGQRFGGGGRRGDDDDYVDDDEDDDHYDYDYQIYNNGDIDDNNDDNVDDSDWQRRGGKRRKRKKAQWKRWRDFLGWIVMKRTTSMTSTGKNPLSTFHYKKVYSFTVEKQVSISSLLLQNESIWMLSCRDHWKVHQIISNPSPSWNRFKKKAGIEKIRQYLQNVIQFLLTQQKRDSWPQCKLKIRKHFLAFLRRKPLKIWKQWWSIFRAFKRCVHF